MAPTTIPAPTGKRYPRIIAGIALLATVLATVAVCMRVGPFAAIIPPLPPTPLAASDLLPPPAVVAPVADVGGAPVASGNAPPDGGSSGGSTTSHQNSGGQPGGSSTAPVGSTGSNPTAPPAAGAPTATTTTAPTATPTAAPTATPAPGATMAPTPAKNTYSGVVLGSTSTCPSGATASAYKCLWTLVTNGNTGWMAVHATVDAGITVCATITGDQNGPVKAGPLCGVGAATLNASNLNGDFSVIVYTTGTSASTPATVDIGHS